MKMNKLILGACVFSLGIATAASSYHVRIADPTWVGGTQLKPGEYEVKVDGDKVTFKQGKNVMRVWQRWRPMPPSFPIPRWISKPRTVKPS